MTNHNVTLPDQELRTIQNCLLGGESNSPDLAAALGTVLGLITKHGLAVTLAREGGLDFARLEQARRVYQENRP
jgi:hypothetical protein